MSDNYYRFFPGDYHRDTGDLSIIEHGAYRLLLDHYYMRGNLPSDRDRLYRLCRAFNGDEREAIERVVEIFFIDDGECLINKKAEEEIEKRNGYLDEQARKSRLGVEARRKLKEEPTGQPTGQPKGVPLPSPSPSPLPKPIKEKRVENRKRFIPPSFGDIKEYCRERNNGVNPQVWIDFYTANGWMIGKNKMKDWKASVRTWEQRNQTPAYKDPYANSKGGDSWK